MPQYFFVLALLIMIFLNRFKIKLSVSYILTILISFMYALFDEYHQTFVVGRTGQFSDALIDTSGAVIGALVVLIIISLIKNHKVKKTSNKTLPKKSFICFEHWWSSNSTITIKKFICRL